MESFITPNSKMSLIALPDELWISILHEWIDKPLILCAFDIALCNRLLRERYLMWLRDGTRGTFNIFSHIHFETTFEQGKHGMSHQGVLDTFFDWCKRRQLNPKSLSYCFEQTNERGWKISQKALKVMKQVEQLKAYYRLDYEIANTDLVSNILNDCPKLKKLVVHLRDVNNYYPSNAFIFSCNRGSCLLMDVEFIKVRFPLSANSFRKLVDACPNLLQVKFQNCQGIHLCHMLYLLNHTNALKSIDAYFCCDYRDMDDPDMHEIATNNINTAMKSVILINLGALDYVSIATYLLSIFKKCPMVEKVFIDLEEIRKGIFPIIAWCEMIANNWQHLQSLTLQSASWMTNNELIMNALESCCGEGLKELSIEGRVTKELIARICQSFVALESLEVLFDAKIIIQYPAMLQSFQQARFRNTLHTFKVSRVGRFAFSISEEPLDYSHILNCFPALHTIELIITRTFYIVEPLAFLPEVKECVFRISGGLLMFSEVMMNVMMKDFINLKKLTLQNLLLDGTALNTILTLPQLEHLIFHSVYAHDGINNHSVLHPNQLLYPSTSIQLAPLKEFTYVGINGCGSRYPFHQEDVRRFLQHFVSLERLIIPKRVIEDGELLELRQEFRYRTMIITTA